MSADRVLDGFHGNHKDLEKTGEFNEHFWRGFSCFGRGVRVGCGCGYCQRGWETAKQAFKIVAREYGRAELESRQLDLLP